MRKYSLIFLSIIFLFACSSQKELSSDKSNISETEYFSTFTEATKYALLGNFKNALQLYQLCIQEFPEKAAPYYQISNIYSTVNDIPQAKKFGIKAVELNSTNIWYLLHLANIYQFENNLDSLIVLYEQITVLSDNPEYSYNLALFYNAKGEYKKSMSIVKQLEEHLDGSRELYLMKHKNYAALNYQDSAIFQLEKLIYFFPDQFENYGMLAEYLSEINRIEDSKILYKELLLKQPDNGLANLSYGDFFLNQRITDSALFYYKRGFEADDITIEDKIGILYNYLNQDNYLHNDTVFIVSLINVLADKYDDPRPYSLLAEYYVKNQNYDKATFELKNAIDHGADNYIIWEQYIMISNFIGKHDEVKEIYKTAIDRFPNEINLYIFSGYSLYFLHEYDSILNLEQGGLAITDIELDQKVQFMNLLADAYRGINKLEVSDSIYEKILLIDPNNLLIRNNYSYYLSIRNKDLEKAEELSRLTIKSEPKNATYLDTYGWILFKLGRTKEALKFIELAIRNGAYNNSEVLDHYGDIMFELNRYTEAIEAWYKAVSYDSSLNEQIELKIDRAKVLFENE